MRTKLLSRALLFPALLALLSTAALPSGELFDEFTKGAISNYATGGWQGPHQDSNTGGTIVNPPGYALQVDGTTNALAYAVRSWPPMGDVQVEFFFFLQALDGMAEDSISFLLRFAQPTLPGAYPAETHASTGIRVRFNLIPGVMEVLEESNYQSLLTGLSLQVPLAMPSYHNIKLVLQGQSLSVYRSSVYQGTLTVPAVPAGRFGFEVRGTDLIVGSIRLTCSGPDDFDCDGVADAADNCPQDPNVDQRDNDQDGLGDLCDADDDNDALVDTTDNCPLVYNPAQDNQDSDAFGDACDVCPTDALNDDDGDGVCGSTDNCPYARNPLQEDWDLDGEGDLCDLDDRLTFVYLTDPSRVAWQDDWHFQAFNVYRGDLEALRSSGEYTQDPALHPLASQACDRGLNEMGDGFTPPVGTGVFYLVSGREEGVEGNLGSDSAGNPRANGAPCPACRPYTTLIWTTEYLGDIPEQYRVIYTREEWCAFLPSACNTSSIDFATEVAVVAETGGRSDLCYGVAIACIQDGPIAPDIHFTVRETIGACTCSPAVGYPLHVVKIPRPVGAATYQKTLESPMACPR